MTDDVAYLDTMDEVLIMAMERNLIAAGHLSDGQVNVRSIVAVARLTTASSPLSSIARPRRRVSPVGRAGTRDCPRLGSEVPRAPVGTPQELFAQVQALAQRPLSRPGAQRMALDASRVNQQMYAQLTAPPQIFGTTLNSTPF